MRVCCAVLASLVVGLWSTSPSQAAGGFGWLESAPLTGAVAAGTTATGLLNSAGDPRVFFVAAADNKIHDLSYSSASGWTVGPARSEVVAAGSNPSAVDFGDGGLRVYYVSAANKRIREVGWDPTRGWGDAYASLSNDTVADGSSPSAVNVGADGIRIYYVGATNKRIRELGYSPTRGWGDGYASLSNDDVATGTSPSAVNVGADGVRVYYVGAANMRIREVGWSPTRGWGDGYTSLSAENVAANTSPSAINVGADGVRIYYVAASSKHLREVGWSPVRSWGDAYASVSTEAVATGTSPSAISIGADGVRIYYVGAASGGVREVGWNAVRGWGDVYSPLTGAVTAGTSPLALGTTQGNVRVYFAGASAKVREVSYNRNPGWDPSGPLSGAVAAGTTPTGILNGGDDPRLFFVSAADNKIHDLSFSAGTGWTVGPARSEVVAAGSSPSAIDFGDGGLRVYYVAAANKRIREVGWDPTRGWGDVYTSLSLEDVAAGTSPSAIRLPSEGVRIYYVAASTKKIREVGWNATRGWGDVYSSLSTEAVATGTNPDAIALGDGGLRVYYVAASSKHIRELGWDPTRGWGDAYSSLSAQAVATGSSPAAAGIGNGAVRIEYVGATDQAIHEISFDAGPGWVESGARSARVAANTSPSIFLNGTTRRRVSYVAEADQAVHELQYRRETGAWTVSPALSSATRTGSSPFALASPGGRARAYSVDDAFGAVEEAYSAPVANWGALLASHLDLAGDSEVAGIFDFLPPFDHRDAETAMRTRLVDGWIVKDLYTGTAYFYFGGAVRRITSAMAGTLGISLNGLKRTTTANLAGFTHGPDMTATDWACGGANHAIDDTPADLNCVADRVRDAASDGAAGAVLADITANVAAVERTLIGRLADGDLARNINTGEVSNYAQGQFRLIPSTAVATAVGANLSAAKRVTTSGINASGYSWGPEIGPYTTSWNYGGPNRAVDTDTERQSVVAAVATSGDDSASGAALLAGLSPDDRAGVQDPEPQQDPDIPVPPDGGDASSAHTFYCDWVGQQIGRWMRPLDPYISSNNVYGAGSFRCDKGDIGRAVNMKVCIQKWFPRNDGRFIWNTIVCDEETWAGDIGPPGHVKTVHRECTGGNALRIYRVIATMTVYTVHINTYNPIATSTRTSPLTWLPCRAG
jgi:hypothetical protein